jgi:hypothetical protein
MQPYFLPYIGYFQLINAVDVFVVYDDIKYTKKGWINRNRMLRDGEPVVFSLPLKSASDALDVRDREVALDFTPARLLSQMAAAYRRAPHREATLALVERALSCGETNLFEFVLNSIKEVCAHLGIATQLCVSSSLGVDRGLKGQDRVLATCERLGATTYVNPIGGTGLYASEAFAERGVSLRFLRSARWVYDQAGRTFVPSLSIVDVLMYNPPEVVRDQLEHGFDLVEGAVA